MSVAVFFARRRMPKIGKAQPETRSILQKATKNTKTGEDDTLPISSSFPSFSSVKGSPVGSAQSVLRTSRPTLLCHSIMQIPRVVRVFIRVIRVIRGEWIVSEPSSPFSPFPPLPSAKWIGFLPQVSAFRVSRFFAFQPRLPLSYLRVLL